MYWGKAESQEFTRKRLLGYCDVALVLSWGRSPCCGVQERFGELSEGAGAGLNSGLPKEFQFLGEREMSLEAVEWSESWL